MIDWIIKLSDPTTANFIKNYLQTEVAVFMPPCKRLLANSYKVRSRNFDCSLKFDRIKLPPPSDNCQIVNSEF